MTAPLPLEGVRVVSLTGVWAGPFAEQVLADWGAEVIRVESTQFFQPNTRGRSVRPTGEVPLLRRGWGMGYPDWQPGERPWNRYAMFQCHARNKLSMTADLLRQEGRAILHRLLRISDILIENNVPETTERLGLTYEEVRNIRADIIMVRMPAYGLSGPYKNFRSFGAQPDGAIGHAWLRGYADADLSVRNDVLLPDAVAGLHGAVAAMMALRQRRQTGKGQLVELPLAETSLPLLAEALLDCTINGPAEHPGEPSPVALPPRGCINALGRTAGWPSPWGPRGNGRASVRRWAAHPGALMLDWPPRWDDGRARTPWTGASGAGQGTRRCGRRHGCCNGTEYRPAR